MTPNNSTISVFEYEELDSTSSEAKRLVENGQDGDFAVSAIKQLAGRGRFGRAWHAAGNTVAMTICVSRPKMCADFTTLPLMTGVALHKVLSPLLNDQANLKIKWPNDILINDAKLSGTLIEVHASRIFVGIGMNLDTAPENVIYPTTYLSKYVAVKRSDIIRAIADGWYKDFCGWVTDGFAYLAEYYQKNLWRRGEEISIFLDEARTKVVKGTCEGIDQSGRILLRTVDGSGRVFSTGDVGGVHRQ
jgi:BirA family transcriptional regulator, biotin operon repressor / biotin---[acetyl-CoA-carboxylase] ligase